MASIQRCLIPESIICWCSFKNSDEGPNLLFMRGLGFFISFLMCVLYGCKMCICHICYMAKRVWKRFLTKGPFLAFGTLEVFTLVKFRISMSLYAMLGGGLTVLHKSDFLRKEREVL